MNASFLFLISGFGSTTRQTIQTNSVHYDCGFIITQNGNLMQFERAHPSVLNVPTVYVAYFSTFGVLVSFFLSNMYRLVLSFITQAWHLLLFNESVQNLHDPILVSHAIADNTVVRRVAGNNERTKVYHFIRARLLSLFFKMTLL